MATALLVIDMQKVFLPMTTTALPNILKLIAHFRTRNLPVMFTQHGHSDAELTPPFQNQLVRKWGPDGSIRTGSEGWEFINEIGKEVREAEVLVRATIPSAVSCHCIAGFGKTENLPGGKGEKGWGTCLSVFALDTYIQEAR